MTVPPSFQLPRLREIGWAKWDPIGLAGELEWPSDEYDVYLLEAAGRLWNGDSDVEVADYLLNIETEHMWLEAGHGARQRLVEVVEAVRHHVETLRS